MGGALGLSWQTNMHRFCKQGDIAELIQDVSAPLSVVAVEGFWCSCVIIIIMQLSANTYTVMSEV